MAFWVCYRDASHKKSTLHTSTLQGGQNVPKFVLCFVLSDRSDDNLIVSNFICQWFANLSTRFSDSFPDSDLSCFCLQLPRFSF